MSQRFNRHVTRQHSTEHSHHHVSSSDLTQSLSQSSYVPTSTSSNTNIVHDNFSQETVAPMSSSSSSSSIVSSSSRSGANSDSIVSAAADASPTSLSPYIASSSSTGIASSLTPTITAAIAAGSGTVVIIIFALGVWIWCRRQTENTNINEAKEWANLSPSKKLDKKKKDGSADTYGEKRLLSCSTISQSHTDSSPNVIHHGGISSSSTCATLASQQLQQQQHLDEKNQRTPERSHPRPARLVYDDSPENLHLHDSTTPHQNNQLDDPFAFSVSTPATLSPPHVLAMGRAISFSGSTRSTPRRRNVAAASAAVSAAPHQMINPSSSTTTLNLDGSVGVAAADSSTDNLQKSASAAPITAPGGYKCIPRAMSYVSVDVRASMGSRSARKRSTNNNNGNPNANSTTNKQYSSISPSAQNLFPAVSTMTISTSDPNNSSSILSSTSTSPSSYNNNNNSNNINNNLIACPTATLSTLNPFVVTNSTLNDSDFEDDDLSPVVHQSHSVQPVIQYPPPLPPPPPTEPKQQQSILSHSSTSKSLVEQLSDTGAETTTFLQEQFVQVREPALSIHSHSGVIGNFGSSHSLNRLQQGNSSPTSTITTNTITARSPSSVTTTQSQPFIPPSRSNSFAPHLNSGSSSPCSTPRAAPKKQSTAFSTPSRLSLLQDPVEIRAAALNGAVGVSAGLRKPLEFSSTPFSENTTTMSPPPQSSSRSSEQTITERINYRQQQLQQQFEQSVLDAATAGGAETSAEDSTMSMEDDEEDAEIQSVGTQPARKISISQQGAAQAVVVKREDSIKHHHHQYQHTSQHHAHPLPSSSSSQSLVLLDRSDTLKTTSTGYDTSLTSNAENRDQFEFELESARGDSMYNHHNNHHHHTTRQHLHQHVPLKPEQEEILDNNHTDVDFLSWVPDHLGVGAADRHSAVVDNAAGGADMARSPVNSIYDMYNLSRASSQRQQLSPVQQQQQQQNHHIQFT